MTTLSDWGYDKAINPEKIWSTILARNTSMGAVRSKILKILQAEDQIGRSNRETKGKLDRKAFSRFATGQADIFTQRNVKLAENTAVSIFIDTSSSMYQRKSRGLKDFELDKNYRAIDGAREVSIQLSNIISKTNSEFAVQGFTDASSKTDVTIYQYKKWGKKLTPKEKFKISTLDCVNASGTPVYESLRWAIQDISKVQSKKKVLFIITDAVFHYNAIKQIPYLESLAEKLGIKIVAIGLETNSDLTGMFKHSANVNLDDLFGQSFGQILKAIS
tara:strand:+ start:2385 stop:3209 length:825 start_codon:yes stop_codon:yes gene_type:complete